MPRRNNDVMYMLTSAKIFPRKKKNVKDCVPKENFTKKIFGESMLGLSRLGVSASPLLRRGFGGGKICFNESFGGEWVAL